MKQRRKSGSSVLVKTMFFVATVLCLTGVLTTRASTHPHVFVDGGVDFVLVDETILTEVQVTWLYDAFETLYILSSYGMSLNSVGELDEQDRRKLAALRSVWPSDFDGSAHLEIGDKALALAWPAGTDAHLIDGRLQITFSRRLETPINLAGSTLNASFYESTYFFAFKITKPPELVGEVGECGAKIIPFVADPKNSALQATLAKLSREETPEDRQVGALFADRIALQCA